MSFTVPSSSHVAYPSSDDRTHTFSRSATDEIKFLYRFSGEAVLIPSCLFMILPFFICIQIRDGGVYVLLSYLKNYGHNYNPVLQEIHYDELSYIPLEP